ncbi:HAD-IA family hydrolase [Sulfurisphaera javensis]|uniref:HAD-IA family hydrolase n=1 Tax=Sulfurisphaera javensis TaxID=2049879 RepID=A0AAT9GPW8_9CREN
MIVSLDMGDTLIAFTPRKYEKIYEILKDNGYIFSLKKVYKAYIRTMAKHYFPDSNGVNPFDLRDFFYELGINPSNEKLVKEIKKIDRGEEYWVYDEVIDFLEKLKSKGHKLVLVSNATPRGKEVFYKLGLNKYFDFTIFSFEVGLVKPNPKIFSLVIRNFGKPRFHIGDIYEMDIKGARDAGIEGILLNRFNFYEFGVKNLKEIKFLEE